MGTQLPCSQDAKGSATAISTACPHPQPQTAQEENENSHGYKQVSLTQRLHQRKHRLGTVIWLLVDDKTLCCVCKGGVFPLVLGLLRESPFPLRSVEQHQSKHCPSSSSSPRAGQCRVPCGDQAWVPGQPGAPHAPQGQRHTECPQPSQAEPLLLCTSCLFPTEKKKSRLSNESGNKSHRIALKSITSSLLLSFLLI